jgi:hypothetical protein
VPGLGLGLSLSCIASGLDGQLAENLDERSHARFERLAWLIRCAQSVRSGYADLPVPACTQSVRFVVQANSSVRFFKGAYQDPTSHAALPLQVAVERAFSRLALQRARRCIWAALLLVPLDCQS